MTWTPESLARAFHESYARAAAKAYGNRREPESWDSLSEQARSLFVEACSEVLGVEATGVTQPPPEAVPVPTREEFEAAMEAAVGSEAEGDSSEGGGDWYADLQRQIDGITAPKIRRAFKTAGEPLRK